jgi:hypothetical protein
VSIAGAGYIGVREVVSADSDRGISRAIYRGEVHEGSRGAAEITSVAVRARRVPGGSLEFDEVTRGAITRVLRPDLLLDDLKGELAPVVLN